MYSMKKTTNSMRLDCIKSLTTIFLLSVCQKCNRSKTLSKSKRGFTESRSFRASILVGETQHFFVEKKLAAVLHLYESTFNKPFILLPCTHIFHVECFINYISCDKHGLRNVRIAKKISRENSHSHGNYVGQHKMG